MNVPLDEVIYFDAITSTPSTGAAVDADAAPTFAVYEEATDTDIGVGGNMTKRTSLTGNYRGTFTLSAANGFEVGKWYSVIGTGVVGGVTGKAVLKNFRVVAAENTAGFPTTDVSKINNVATTSVTSVNANIGTTQPVNFTGTGATAYAKSDLQQWIGVAPLALSSQQVQAIVPDTQKVDVNTIKTQTVTCAAGVTVNVNVGTTQPTNFTGVGASALIKVDTIDMAGQAVTITGTAPDVNVVSITDTVDFTTTMHDSLNQSTPSVTVSDKTGFKLAADGTDLVLVAGKTLPAALKYIGASASGVVSGAGTGTEVFKDFAGVTAFTVTVDASGNRSVVVYA